MKSKKWLWRGLWLWPLILIPLSRRTILLFLAGVQLLRIAENDQLFLRITFLDTTALAVLGVMDLVITDRVISLSSFFPLVILLIGYRALGKEKVGGGDVRLVAAAGLLLSCERSMEALLIGCIAAVPEGLISAGNRGRRGKLFPWGSYLCLGIWVSMLRG